MKIIETKKPTRFREWIAMKLVRLAQWIYPDSEAVKAFYSQLFVDQMIYGQSVVRINPLKIKRKRKISKRFVKKLLDFLRK